MAWCDALSFGVCVITLWARYRSKRSWQTILKLPWIVIKRRPKAAKKISTNQSCTIPSNLLLMRTTQRQKLKKVQSGPSHLETSVCFRSLDEITCLLFTISNFNYMEISQYQKFSVKQLNTYLFSIIFEISVIENLYRPWPGRIWPNAKDNKRFDNPVAVALCDLFKGLIMFGLYC